MKKTVRQIINAAFVLSAVSIVSAEDHGASKLLATPTTKISPPATNATAAAVSKSLEALPAAPGGVSTVMSQETNAGAQTSSWIQVTPRDALDLVKGTNAAKNSPTNAAAPVYVTDMELNDFLLAIADQSGLSFVSCPPLKGLKVSGSFRGESPEDMARDALRPYGFDVYIYDGRLMVSGEKIDRSSPQTTYFHKFKNLKFAVDSGMSKPTEIESFFSSALGLSDGEVCKYSPNANMIIVHTTEDRKARLVDIVNRLDVAKPMVRIAMTIVEVDNNPEKLAGVDWNGVLGSAGVGLTVNVANSIASAVTGGFMPYLGPTGDAHYSVVAQPGQVSLFLRFLESKNLAKSIAKIEVVQKEGEKNSFKAVREQPIPNFQANTVTGGFDLQGFSFKDIGNVLKAQAFIMPGDSGKSDNAEVFVEATVSSMIGSQTFSSSGGSGGGLKADIPIIDNTEVSSYLYVPVGKSMIIGGLKKNENTQIGSRVPLIGRALPFLFSNGDSVSKKRDLAMILTVDVVNASQTVESGEQVQKVMLQNAGGLYSTPPIFNNKTD